MKKKGTNSLEIVKKKIKLCAHFSRKSWMIRQFVWLFLLLLLELSMNGSDITKKLKNNP